MVHGTVGSIISKRFRTAAVARLLIMLGLAACAPSPEDDGTVDIGIGAVPDADAKTLPVSDAGAGGDAGGIREITLVVAGLRGDGLTLEIRPLQQQVAVPADGSWKVPLQADVLDLQLAVLRQPSDLDQQCDVTKLADDVFAIGCHVRDWAVSGTVSGLAGNGLQLRLVGDNAETLAIAGSGAFAFTRGLADGSHYEVQIAQQPSQPRQTCTLEHAAGVADGADVADLAVSCTTNTYQFTSVVTGLTGSGLKVLLGSDILELSEAGTTTHASHPYPDGSRYDIAIVAQPTGPDQVCYIDGGQGVIDGADVTFNVICGASGQLRISEVGSCPYANSSCWFEIYNAGPQPEQLAFYTLRSAALSTGGYVASRVFALPALSIPAYGSVVIAGKTSTAIADGQGVYHVAADGGVPWWSRDGFVELLNPSGTTASFVRFGANETAPTTAGSWGGGAAAALPRGAAAYGVSIQRSFPGPAGLPSGTEYVLRQFATMGGPNDVSDDIDADDDGIPDTAEQLGGTFAGMNLYAMGARPGVRDVFVEIDHMAGGDPATLPRKDALDKLVATFKGHNIALHFDVGSLFSASFDPVNYNLGGGNEVPFAASVGFAPSDSAITDLYDIKAAHMEGRRRMVFYYQLFAWSQRKDGAGGSSGIGEQPGNDSVISLGGFGLHVDTAWARNLLTNYQAATIMHELGHNFGLRHGGGDLMNRKPNYVSVMNYLYSPLGLPIIGNAEGDRYALYRLCKLTSLVQLTNAPTDDVAKFVIDYSSGSSLDIDESAILESRGLGRAGSSAVDFNCNDRVDSAYAWDLNKDGALDVLTDNDDWNALDFVFRRWAPGAENGPSLRFFESVYSDDPFSTDTVQVSEEPCPALTVPSPSQR